MNCYVCNRGEGKNSEWIGCGYCEKKWAHLKCVHLDGVKQANIAKINWLCAYCDDWFKKKKIEEKDGNKWINLVKNVVENKMNATKKDIMEKVQEVGMQVRSMTYADKVKKDLKPVEKNLVIVESAGEDANMREKKEEVANALKGMQITDTRFSDKKIIMNFASEGEMNNAMTKLNHVNDVKAKNVKRKLSPKIMICNVHKEESKDDLMENLIERNDYLKNVDDIENKISFMFSKPASGNTVHYFLRCDPSIRKLIHDHKDCIKLEWGVYSVRDRYWVAACHHCQRYGHNEKNCTAKMNKEDPFCRHCGERHKTDQCNSPTKKCINCIRYKYSETDHVVGDRCCQVLIKEIKNVKDITDHGY